MSFINGGSGAGALVRRNFNVSPGVPAVSGPFDPYWSFVSMLLPLNGANNSTNFPDAKGLTTVVGVGNAKITTAKSKWGGSSYQGSNGSYIQCYLGAGGLMTGDFTLEYWQTGDSNFTNMYSLTGGWYIYNNYLQQYSLNQVVAMYTYGLSSFVHVAISRVSGVIRTFQDGVLTGIVNYSGVVDLQTMVFGYYVPNNVGFFLDNLNDIRVTKNVGRYVNPFAPPTAAFPTQ